MYLFMLPANELRFIMVQPVPHLMRDRITATAMQALCYNFLFMEHSLIIRSNSFLITCNKDESSSKQQARLQLHKTTTAMLNVQVFYVLDILLSNPDKQ